MSTPVKQYVTCYSDPDLDGYACVHAYSEYLNAIGKKTIPGIFGRRNKEVDFVLDEFSITNLKNFSNLSGKQVILVDSSETIGIDPTLDPANVVEIIDHRRINDAHKFPNAKLQIELVGSAATLVAEKYTGSKTTISRESAALLYSAILSNTLNLRAKVTTDRDRKAADWLNGILELDENYVWQMFAAKSDMTGTNLKSSIIQDFTHFVFGGKKVGIGQLELVGAESLIQNRKDEMLKIIKDLKNSRGLDHIFLSVIDLKQYRNLFISEDNQIREIISKVLGVNFDKNLAEREGFIMRKEMVPLIKPFFEAN